MTPRILLAALALLAGLCAAPAQATLVRVGPPPGGLATIQQGIDYAIAHPGVNDIRVHTGVYNESFSVPATMGSGQILISGGWDDTYTTQLPNGALNTVVSPGANQRCATLQPSGGSLGISDLHFRDGNVADLGGGLLLAPTAGASITLFRNLIEQNVVSAANTYVRGGAVAVDASGTGGVTIQGNDFDANRVEVTSGIGAAYGATLHVVCRGQTSCVVTDNLVTGTTARASNAKLSGGAVYMQLEAGATGQFERNRIVGVTLDSGNTGADGLSLYFNAYDTSKLFVRGNRVESGANGYVVNSNELYLSARTGAVATFSDNLVARPSVDLGAYMVAEESSKLFLANMSFVGAHLVVLNSSSSFPAYLSNSLFSATTTGLSNVVQASNVLDYDGANFLAPSLYDYSLRRADPAITDAGNDAPAGGLGVIDIGNGARVRGPHVDVGAWESSDRLFADRFDH